MREAFTNSWKELKELERREGVPDAKAMLNNVWLQGKLKLATKYWFPFSSLYSRIEEEGQGSVLGSLSKATPPQSNQGPTDLSVAAGIWTFSHPPSPDSHHPDDQQTVSRHSAFSVVED
jgi:hypothetical protein